MIIADNDKSQSRLTAPVLFFLLYQKIGDQWEIILGKQSEKCGLGGLSWAASLGNQTWLCVGQALNFNFSSSRAVTTIKKVVNDSNERIQLPKLCLTAHLRKSS